MATRRWSTVWVFAGGCLTGAALIGLNLGSSEPKLSTRAAEPPREFASPPATAAAAAAAAVPAAEPRAPDTSSTPPPEAVAQAPSAAESGNSVADLLVRLEAEYRERVSPERAEKRGGIESEASAPAKTHTVTEDAPSDAARPRDESIVAEATAAKVAIRETPAAARGLAPELEKAPPNGNAVVTEDEKPSAPAPDPALARAGTASDISSISASTGDKRAEQVTAQIQQLTLMQQATLAQQSALLQYLQLLALSGAPRATRPGWSTRQRPKGGRIVATLPSSISDSDNPWGFELQPSVLVH